MLSAIIVSFTLLSLGFSSAAARGARNEAHVTVLVPDLAGRGPRAFESAHTTHPEIVDRTNLLKARANGSLLG
jgi:hypothetical protein